MKSQVMILSESEKNRIRGLYGLVTEQAQISTDVKMIMDNDGFEKEVNDDYDELSDVISDFIVDSVKKSKIKYNPGAKTSTEQNYTFVHNNDNFNNDFINSISRFLKTYGVEIESHNANGNLLTIKLKDSNTVNESVILEQQEISKDNLPKEINDFVTKNKIVGTFYKGDIDDPSNTNVYSFVPGNKMQAGVNSHYTFNLEDITNFNKNSGKLNQCETQVKKRDVRKDELRKQNIKGKERKVIINKEFGDLNYCYSLFRISNIIKYGKQISG